MNDKIATNLHKKLAKRASVVIIDHYNYHYHVRRSFVKFIDISFIIITCYYYYYYHQLLHLLLYTINFTIIQILEVSLSLLPPFLIIISSFAITFVFAISYITVITLLYFCYYKLDISLLSLLSLLIQNPTTDNKVLFME